MQDLSANGKDLKVMRCLGVSSGGIRQHPPVSKEYQESVSSFAEAIRAAETSSPSPPSSSSPSRDSSSPQDVAPRNPRSPSGTQFRLVVLPGKDLLISSDFCRSWTTLVIMYFVVSVTNNYALNFHISMPLHMIFRAVSFPVTVAACSTISHTSIAL